MPCEESVKTPVWGEIPLTWETEIEENGFSDESAQGERSLRLDSKTSVWGEIAFVWKTLQDFEVVFLGRVLMERARQDTPNGSVWGKIGAGGDPV